MTTAIRTLRPLAVLFIGLSMIKSGIEIPGKLLFIISIFGLAAQMRSSKA